MSNQQEIHEVGIIETLKNYKQINADFITYFQQQLEKYDGLVKMKRPFNWLLTDRPAIVEQILRNNHRNYIKTKLVRETLRDEVGNGLPFSNGDYWLKQRRSIQPGFHKKRLEAIFAIMTDEITKYMENTLDKYADGKQEINVIDAMAELTFKVLTTGLFGQKVDTEKIEFFGQSMQFGHHLVINMLQKPYLRPWYFLNGHFRRNENYKKTRNQIILDVIKERRNSNQTHDDLLDMLLESKYDDGTGMNDQQLIDEMVVLFIAGYETTSITMTWTMFLLGSHPEIKDKTLKSIQQTWGNKTISFDDTRKPSYLLQVIKESMRLYPAAWFIDREALEDDTIDGITIKKGQNIGTTTYSLHRNPKYWENPTKFDPERFTPENEKKHFPFSYIPFGSGPRICLGQHFALMELQLILSMFFQRYKFTLVTQEVKLKSSLTLSPDRPVMIKLEKR